MFAYENIKVISSTGEILCKVYLPAKVALVDFDEYEKWVWCQSYLVKDSWDKLLAIVADLINNKGWPSFKIFDGWMISYCISCEQPSIKFADFVHPLYFWSKMYGFVCSNDMCPVNNVLIPRKLFYHTKEIPDKYKQWIDDYILSNEVKLLKLQNERVMNMLNKQRYVPPY